MNKTAINAFCVHGHFYQPPREDPLTEQIPLEPGAAPYQNWNERINDQCYRPNAKLKNFEGISFDIGPTLAVWLDQYDPETLNAIIEQDRVNIRRYGVGNAMAQAYNHTILPLATSEDKKTQISWGIEDFRFRFGHSPMGMWLPETAVDLETLDILAQKGILFTLLAPWQAASSGLDVSKPYWVKCFEGRKIAVFFYNQDLSTRVSFDPGATSNADEFVHKILLPQFNHNNGLIPKDQFLLIASDGEAYGHHHPFRDKFLSYLLNDALKGHSIRKSFPALWLQDHPPMDWMEIKENTSWSCHHGINRWQKECGCTPYGDWKSPLRIALNQIAESIDQVFINNLRPYVSDVWEIRHQYISVITGQIDPAELIENLIRQKLVDDEVNKIALLLEAQFERQRMFTSCGWFFDDFDRIEPKNNINYAAQAIWLTQKATGINLSDAARSILSKVKSWRSGLTADTVLDHHLRRLQEASKESISAFNTK